MREIKLYEGVNGESISHAITITLEKAKTENETSYLLWNGILVPIYPDSTEEECQEQYYQGLKKEGVWQQYTKGDFVRYEDLGKKITNFIKNIKL